MPASTEDRARQVADSVLRMLDGRGGFDAWWEDVTPDVKEEVRRAIAEKVAVLVPAKAEPLDGEKRGMALFIKWWREFYHEGVHHPSPWERLTPREQRAWNALHDRLAAETRVWFCGEDSASAGWAVVVAPTEERAIELAKLDLDQYVSGNWSAWAVEPHKGEHVAWSGSR